jgi:hypothetical protein
LDESHNLKTKKKKKKKKKKKPLAQSVIFLVADFRDFMKNISEKDYSITHSKYVKKSRKTREDFIKLQNHQKSPQLPII